CHRGPPLGLRESVAILRALRGGKARRELTFFVLVRRAAAISRTVLWTGIYRRSYLMEPKSIDHIFWDAAQIPSASERDAYLARACAEDVALRRRIEQLLQARPKAESFLESPAPPLIRTIQERSMGEGLGTIIGP